MVILLIELNDKINMKAESNIKGQNKILKHKGLK